jgi:hypothetical protein
MTLEVGAVTGEVTLYTELDGAHILKVSVSYLDSEECYTVEGSPCHLVRLALPAHLHERVAAHLMRNPGVDEWDNPLATDLRGIELFQGMP